MRGAARSASIRCIRTCAACARKPVAAVCPSSFTSSTSCGCRCGAIDRPPAERGHAMATRDDLLATLESIHAAGLDEREWPAALSAVTHLLGAVAATFEEFAKTPLQHRAFHTFGLPPLRELEYVDQYIACSPRIPAGLTWRTGRV